MIGTWKTLNPNATQSMFLQDYIVFVEQPLFVEGQVTKTFEAK
jgi:hypothetical protein